MNTPICPVCGAKFAHDPETMQCRKCLVTDEIIAAGSNSIKTWKVRTGFSKPPGTSSRPRKNKHGVPRSKGRYVQTDPPSDSPLGLARRRYRARNRRLA